MEETAEVVDPDRERRRQRDAEYQVFAEIALRKMGMVLPDLASRAAKSLGIPSPGSLTLRYCVHNEMGWWLVGYIQADGLVTFHTSEGCWGHTWSHHGCKTVLHWLAAHGLHDLSYYIPEKLSNGEREYDGEATYKRLKEHLNESAKSISEEYRGLDKMPQSAFYMARRKERDKRRAELKRLRELLRRLSDGENSMPKERLGQWHDEANIADGYELFVYKYPEKLTRMLQYIWPAFIEAVRKDVEWRPRATTPLDAWQTSLLRSRSERARVSKSSGTRPRSSPLHGPRMPNAPTSRTVSRGYRAPT